MYLQEEVLMRMNKYPKMRYELVVARKLAYSFVTTSRSVEDCIKLMKSKTEMYATRSKRLYQIVQVTSEGRNVIYKGAIDPIH